MAEEAEDFRATDLSPASGPSTNLTKNSFIVGEGKMAETYVLASMRKKDRVSFVDADTNKLRTVRALRAHFVGKPT